MDTGVSTLFDKTVFQATRNIFVGEKAKTRKLKGIKRYVREHLGDKTSVVQLTTQYGAGAVHGSILKLLSNGVYESTSIAHEWFPDLFEPSVTRTEAMEILEGVATSIGQTILEDVHQIHSNDNHECPEEPKAVTILNDINGSIARNEIDNSSVYAVYLPFPAAHMLMEKLQKTLELACYQFGLRALPSLMRKQGWDCPQAGELNKWTKIFGRTESVVWEGSGKPSKELLRSIAAIRHATVHRQRTNSAELERFLADAETLTGALGEKEFTQAISQLRMDTQETLAELIHNKEMSQAKLERAQEEIARHRAELDQREQEILRHAESEDRKYRDLAGERLKGVLGLVMDVKVVSHGQAAVLTNGDDVEDYLISDDDSDSDYNEQFEDCSEV
ncbi:hypothetical protein ACHAPM_008893 [Fusarium culmorum]